MKGSFTSDSEDSAAECNNAAEAFNAHRGSVPGYTGNGVKQATFKEGLVARPTY